MSKRSQNGAKSATGTTSEVDVAALERAVKLETAPVRQGEKNEANTKRRAVMSGNWKLNPKTAADAKTLAALVGAARRDVDADVDVFVCPPAPFLADVVRVVR